MRRREALAAAAAVVLRGSRASAQGTTALRVGGATADTSAQAYFAEGGGFFKQSRLDVEIIQLASTGALVSAVVGGAMDIGTGSPLAVVGAREQGIPLAIIGPGAVSVESVPTTLLMVAKSSPLRTASDLEGKTVASPSLRGLTEISVQAWMTQNHADPSKVKYVEMPFTAMPPALERGTIDAAMIAEPTLTASRAVARDLANPYAAIAKEWYISAWFVREDWLAKNRDAARAFLQAMMKTQAWANTHHAETAQILQKVAKLPDDVLAKMVRARFGTKLDGALLQPLIDSSTKVGITKGTVSAKDILVFL